MHLNVDFFLNVLQESHRVFFCLENQDFMVFVTIPLKMVSETTLESKFISNILYTYELL